MNQESNIHSSSKVDLLNVIEFFLYILGSVFPLFYLHKNKRLPGNPREPDSVYLSPVGFLDIGNAFQRSMAFSTVSADTS